MGYVSLSISLKSKVSFILLSLVMWVFGLECYLLLLLYLSIALIYFVCKFKKYRTFQEQYAINPMTHLQESMTLKAVRFG